MATITTVDLGQGELRAVENVLRDAGADPVAPLIAELIAGGRSNLTYRLSDGQSDWVMRTPPRVGRTPSAHDVVREFTVCRALVGTGVPVPAPVALCTDEAVIGVPFAVAEFVSGVTIQERVSLEALTPGTIAALAECLVSTLAALHRVDHVAVGLGDFGRADGYAARQLKRWAGQWELIGAESLDPLARSVIDRLVANLPEQRSTGIVHGDFRIDNALLRLDGNDQASVAAVVDWELCTIGDPVADVAMMCAYRHPVFDLIVGAPSAWASPRLPGVDAVLAQYESAGGALLVDWPSHLALAYFKIAVIAAGIEHRRAVGGASGPGFDTAGQAVETYLDLALAEL